MTVSFIRTIILYIAVIFSLRIMGKRQIGDLSPAELVITILVSELASIPMQDFDLPLISGIIPIFALISFEIIISFLCIKIPYARKIFNGSPCIIIKDGKFDKKQMSDLRLTVDEILEELRVNNITDISEIKYAIIETSGQLTYILKEPFRPATVQDVKAKPQESSLPLILINDGRVFEENLKILNKNNIWLQKQLDIYKISNLKQIFLMTGDECGNVFLQKNEV